MELEEERLTIPINPNNFPAKLWRLVNNPKNRSIRWDPCGEGLIIDQQLFEAELLSPQKQTFDKTDIFKTTNFTSFNRQLNLYGFRKVVHGPGGSEKNDGSYPTDGIKHHFHNPNFKQDHPELLVNLKRLTSKNKAKMEAGLEVNCRPPANRFHRLMANCDGGEQKVKVDKRGSMFVGQVKRPSPYQQYHQSRSQPMKDYDRTPIPPRGWIMGHGDAPSPTTFYTDKGIPISVIHRFPSDTSCTVQSSPTTVHMQQGSQSLANSLIPHHAQYRPGFYSPASVCQCCPPGSMDSDCGSAHQTTPSFSHYSYYQPNCPVGFLYPGNQNQDWESSETQETKKSDVNLDTVFQLVDELHHSSPKIRMVKVETPERQQPVLYTSTSSGPQSTTTIHSSPHTVTVSSQFDSSVNSSSLPGPIVMDASPVTPRGPIIIAVPGNVPPQGIAITVGGPVAEQPVKREYEPVPVDAYQKCPEEASEYITKVKEIQVVDAEVCGVLRDGTVCSLGQ
ncbi:heat shock factor protein 5 isoform X1 [Coregonus clupeaformis]|uniref:heat shock factor protein 5 isoform X1 n=1 Tax=Coregonus clupeaformis TaxID=59861 RepID=UPI001E1C319E|nr:heat shock factor protein 5 isoform X1 [Coregonus clupeaformis]XP_041751126.2 heat shock factor protein 5 isoform X1 [Coregonus clupeaformis]